MEMNEQATYQQQQHLMNMNQSLMSMNQMNPHPPQPQMIQMNHSYGVWSQPQQFQNPNLNPVTMKQPSSAFNKSLGPRNNWKGKRVKKPNDKRRPEQQKSLLGSGGVGGVNMVSGGTGRGTSNFINYNPPTLNELQHKNRLKTRKYFSKKKFNKKNMMNMNMNMNMSGSNARLAPFAPRNTTSFLIRAKRSGGIAPMISPYPVTPAVLPTPILSPSTEVLGDMAKEEWGVDGYGSMKGLIRLRSSGHEMEINEDEEEYEGGSSESDVEEHVEVERRLDHDLSRFEMIYDPNSVNFGGIDHQNVLENRLDDQGSHIAQLEEENLILKEKLFLMEREFGDLRRRLLCLERSRNKEEDINEEVVENESENESESPGEEAQSKEVNNEEDGVVKSEGDDAHIDDGSEGADGDLLLCKEGKSGIENEEKWINAASESVNEESINVADNPVDHDDDENKKYVDVVVETKDNIDTESYKHVVEGNNCILDGEVAKDNMVS